MEKQVVDIENLKAPKIEVYFDSQDQKKDLQTAGCNAFYSAITDATIAKFKSDTKKFSIEDLRIKESDKYCWTIIKIPIKGGYSQAHEYVCISLLDDDKVIGTCRVKYSTLIQGGSVKKVDHVKTISQVIDTFG